MDLGKLIRLTLSDMDAVDENAASLIEESAYCAVSEEGNVCFRKEERCMILGVHISGQEAKKGFFHGKMPLDASILFFDKKHRIQNSISPKTEEYQLLRFLIPPEISHIYFPASYDEAFKPSIRISDFWETEITEEIINPEELLSVIYGGLSIDIPPCIRLRSSNGKNLGRLLSSGTHKIKLNVYIKSPSRQQDYLLSSFRIKSGTSREENGIITTEYHPIAL